LKRKMTVFETIKRRRSIGKMTAQSPTRAQVEQILEAATHAPNHHKVEPWRFIVLAGKARNELGEIMAATLAEKLASTEQTNAQAIIEKERNKPLRSPVLIVVAAEHARQPKVLDIENIEAAAAGVQNMLLTAEEMGLAAMWRTGDGVYDLNVKKWLGLAPEDHIVAFLYLGYPAIEAQERQPQTIENKTAWLGWEE
jgi:nitroreductase